jgi:uncharacterized SAM-binding protein YcdF (DUF218 family)
MQTVYSLIKYLLTPEVWIFLGLSAVCITAWTRPWPRSARIALSIVLLVYYGFTTAPLMQALVVPLESSHQRPEVVPADQDAIVILTERSPPRPDTGQPTIIGTANVDLLVCGLPYARGHRAARIVLTTGGADGATGPIVLRQWAQLLGYPVEAIMTENEAIATHERAHAIKRRLSSAQKILLVDSAMHLPRSAAAFKKAGFEVTPIPCNYETSTEPWNFSSFVPQANRFDANSDAVHEYIGLLAYWLRGFI